MIQYSTISHGEHHTLKPHIWKQYNSLSMKQYLGNIKTSNIQTTTTTTLFNCSEPFHSKINLLEPGLLVYHVESTTHKHPIGTILAPYMTYSLPHPTLSLGWIMIRLQRNKENKNDKVKVTP